VQPRGIWLFEDGKLARLSLPSIQSLQAVRRHGTNCVHRVPLSVLRHSRDVDFNHRHLQRQSTTKTLYVVEHLHEHRSAEAPADNSLQATKLLQSIRDSNARTDDRLLSSKWLQWRGS
jgi:hypothetical protein